MLDTNLKTQLTAYLTKVTQPIELVAALDNSDASREMRALLDDIVSLSNQITLKLEKNPIVRAPSFSINRVHKENGNVSIRFAGIPMGHEFTSLVLALLQTGGHPPKVDASVIEQIKQLDGDFHFETYISLTCQNCPEVVQSLNLMAVLNPRISSVVIDGALFQNEVEQRQIMAVPTIFLNGKILDQGRISLEEILAKLDSGSEKRAAEQLNIKEPFD
ncbi:MAG: alkyl hydroperoxide reductase, subunit, partial [Solimicrobium sp.]|nr:alkyl hydroperoxide reductase, subunit [Solimicrobium sp.]